MFGRHQLPSFLFLLKDIYERLFAQHCFREQKWVNVLSGEKDNLKKNERRTARILTMVIGLPRNCQWFSLTILLSSVINSKWHFLYGNAKCFLYRFYSFLGLCMFLSLFYFLLFFNNFYVNLYSSLLKLLEQLWAKSNELSLD